MTKRALSLGLSLFLLCASFEASAQSDVALATRADKLQKLSEKLKKRDKSDRQQAREWARQKGVPMRRELPDGKVLELQRAKPGKKPVFYITNNVDAADTVSTDEVWPGGSAGLFLDGTGMTVGEWDAGAVLGDHPDLHPRVNQVDGATIISNHSTHVAGTLIGAGVALLPEARGMAYAANLDAYDWNSDTAEMAAAAVGGLLTSNHSYGIATGWIYMGGTGADAWWWIGGSGDEDPNFGYYDTITQQWDQIAYDAPYYLIVKAAGNDRWDTGPGPGQPYTVVDQDGTFEEYSSTSRPADCTPGGYDCLPTVSVAKNILTVGAVDDVIGGYLPLAGPAGVEMTAFSGWGPTDDGRIKPDVVANGWLLMSTYGQDPYYAAAVGTSMAAPNVTGSLLLLQQHYQDLHGSGNFMRAATLKALAIHTADETGAADGPDYEYGWGLLNTKSAAAVISDDYSAGGTHQIIEGSLANNPDVYETVLEFFVSDPDAVVTATLVWTDPPGTPPALDPTESMLVNDLDLRISNGGLDYKPWVLLPGSPSAAATTDDNTLDNVEQVVVNGGGSGTYSIKIKHKNILLGGTAQDYSLIISIGSPPPTSSGLLIDEDFSGGLPTGWSVVTGKGQDWTIRTPVPGDPRYDNSTGGSGNFAMVDNYVDPNFFDTNTSLRTPVLDLSSATAAVLSFNSFFWYHEFEKIYVDVSTNGGSTWSTAWWHQGISNTAKHHTLDLTGYIAGHNNVMLRFKFESSWALGYDGDRWQIDDVQLEAFGSVTPPEPPPVTDPPGQADNPIPTNGSSGIGVDTVLSWSSGQTAGSHDIYLGASSSLGPGEFQGNQAGNSFDPGGLAYDTTYYWRVDEVNGDGTTEGVTWSFSTEIPDATLTPDTLDIGMYGNGYGTNQNPTEVIATFEYTGTDMVLSVTGYDIDKAYEISVYLNGAPLGDLSSGPNNALNGGDTFAIPASDQLPGTNQVKFVQNIAGYRWGVTGLLLTEGVIIDTVLTPDALDTGMYGNGYGTNQNPTEVIATFEYTGTDMVLSVTGYDIDKAYEISVYLNGAPLGDLSSGPNNALNGGDTFAIPASDQLPGTNQIQFVQNIAGWIWGVTGLLLTEGVIIDTVLTPDALDTGMYGNGYGTNQNPTEVIATFEYTGTDMVLSVTGYDIDKAYEISVYLNGVPLGDLSRGPNNALNDGDTFAIPASDQLPGTNQVKFVENIAGWNWGVTGLLLTEGVIIDTVLTLDALDTGMYGNGYGTNQNPTEVIATFEYTGTDMVLSVTGYDVDSATEISVYLNGILLGYLSQGPNNDLNSGDSFAISATAQLPATNQVKFVENIAGYRWGVTNIQLSQ